MFLLLHTMDYFWHLSTTENCDQQKFQPLRAIPTIMHTGCHLVVQGCHLVVQGCHLVVQSHECTCGDPLPYISWEK